MKKLYSLLLLLLTLAVPLHQSWAQSTTASLNGTITDNTGSPLPGATVVATVTKQFKAPKVTAFKFRKRKGYHLTKGHRQPLTRVQIVSINA